ncbi:hypothetical protein EDD18DRAFT_1350105 [Armillaria luteobubalina]|uniref:DUF6534 domain-containing protein n=1 Tax=Armillaria luteobubalina TaxID=153913 RepID=A0AA39UYU2_9AGAR|nr:hypothetical protein EDD18DRAFT_1350105 [Armillaria luteobubalina]
MQPVPAGYPIAEVSGPYVYHWLSIELGALRNTFCATLSILSGISDDSRFLKYLVYGIYIIESVQTILVAHDTFAMFGYGFGDMDALTRLNYNWVTVPITSAVAAGVGQVFYAYRIFVVSKSRIISIFIICISITSSAAAMVAGISAFQVGAITKFNTRKIHITIGIWCGASALCDIVIAICMTHYLTMRSTTTNFRRTRILVTKIIRLTIETGSVTAVVALLNYVLFIALPHQNTYMTFGVIVPKLYANTVYMVLNSRFQIIGGRDTYISSIDASVPTTMIRDITSQSAQGTRSPDDRQGRVPVVAISKEEFNETSYEMGQMNDKLRDSCLSLPA